MARGTLGGVTVGFVLLFLLSIAVDLMFSVVSTQPNIFDISWGPNTVLSVIGSLAFNFMNEWDETPKHHE